jgi:aminopeptidase N
VPIGLPVESYDDLEYGAIVYGRGPLFLMALSAEMGEGKFHQFLKDYFTAYTWKVATRQGFQDLAEITCGCDLDPLFNEWVTIE